MDARESIIMCIGSLFMFTVVSGNLVFMGFSANVYKYSSSVRELLTTSTSIRCIVCLRNPHYFDFSTWSNAAVANFSKVVTFTALAHCFPLTRQDFCVAKSIHIDGRA